MKDFVGKMRDRHWQREDRRLEQKEIKRFRKEELFCRSKEKVKVQRYVHMVFIYACEKCGERRWMWIEKGLEEECNPMLKEKSGLPHKPTPFCIGCPECGGFMRHVSTYCLEKFKPAQIGDDLFINVENHDCGKPVFDWDGR